MTRGPGLTLTEGILAGLRGLHHYRFLTIPQFARVAGIRYKHAAEVLLSLERRSAVGFVGYTSIPGQGKGQKYIFSNNVATNIFWQRVMRQSMSLANISGYLRN